MVQYQLVPDFILSQAAAGRSNGRFSAAVLFVDVSGFTPLTSALMTHGKAGSETIANVLDDIFVPLINLIHNQGGFVAGFAGDSFKAIFPYATDTAGGQETAVRRVIDIAWTIRQTMQQNQAQQTPFGTFSFAIKIAVSAGEVAWGIWSSSRPNPTEQQQTYYFEGVVLSDCLAADAVAQADEIILTDSVRQHLPRHTYTATGAVYQLNQWTPPQFAEEPAAPFTPADQSGFFPEQEMPLSRGEFRQVVTLFVNLPAWGNEAETAVFVHHLFELLHQYNGYLCRVGRIGDQEAGTTLLLFWGAPTSHENDIERALGFALDLQTASPLPMRIGISTSLAYAGYVGAPRRAEYTCYGSYVNLAARLMTRAQPNQILLDSETTAQGEEHYVIDDLGLFELKGFADKLPLYQLQQRKQATTQFYGGELIGREAETAVLIQALTPLTQGQSAGIISVSGEAGIGKSRLVHHTLEHSLILDSAELFLCQCDELLRQPLNPFTYLLRALFEQTPNNTPRQNSTRFSQIYSNLIQSAIDPAQAAELQRTQPYLEYLLGLPLSDPTIQAVDPRLRFDNTQLGLKTLLRRLAQDQAIILHIEDAHWIDDGSQEFIRFLMRNTEQVPMAVLVTSRQQLPESLLDSNSPLPQTAVHLQPLAMEKTAEFVQDWLQAPADPTLIQTLHQRTDGNPFFMEQMLMYWQEHNLLSRTPTLQWQLTASSDAIPSDIRTVLLARLDRLIQSVRNVVQTAAVLGREFEINVLSRMLQNDDALLDKVARAEQDAIWVPLSDLAYLFKHALLRDAAYEMQLEERLQTLHALAADAIQQLHVHDIEQRAADLAFHYDRAAQPAEAIHWYTVAGKRAADQYANQVALAYLNRALTLVGPDDPVQRFDLLLEREDVFRVLGDRDAQGEDVAEMDRLMAQLGDETAESLRRQTDLALRHSNYADLLSEMEEAARHAQTAVSLARKIPDQDRLCQAYIFWGKSLWPVSRLDEALEKVKTALEIANTHQLRRWQGNSHRYLGVIYDLQGQFHKSREHSQQAIAILREINDREGEGGTLNNIGTTYFKQGNYPAARESLENALTIHRQHGYRPGQSWALGNLGVLSIMMADYEAALTYFEEAHTLFSELGDEWSQALATGHLGTVAAHRGQYDASYAYHRQTKAVFEKTSYQQGVGNALVALSHNHTQLGNFARAEEDLNAALTIFRTINAARNESQALTMLSQVRRLQGDGQTAVSLAEQALDMSRSNSNRQIEGLANTHLGDAYAAMGAWPAAITAYEQAVELRKQLGEGHLLMDSLAGLAGVYLAQGNVEAAQTAVLPILDFLETRSLDGANNPGQIYWTTYRVLQEQNDPRAPQLLREGYQFIKQRADQLADPAQRQGYWQSNPAHVHLRQQMQAT